MKGSARIDSNATPSGLEFCQDVQDRQLKEPRNNVAEGRIRGMLLRLIGTNILRPFATMTVRQRCLEAVRDVHVRLTYVFLPTKLIGHYRI